MDPAVDLSKLGAVAARVLDPKSPAPMRQMAARGVVPGLKPSETLTIIAVLAESDDAAVAATARATLEKLPPQLVGGLTAELQPGVVDAIAMRHPTDLAMMERILALPQIPLTTIAELLERLNTRPFQRLDGCRRTAFESIDRPVMKALPASRYEVADWKNAK